MNQAFSGRVIVNEVDVPPAKESVTPNDPGDDGGKDLGLSYDLLDSCSSPAIHCLWGHLSHLAPKTFEGAVKRIEKNTSDRVDSFSKAPSVKMGAGISPRSGFNVGAQLRLGIGPTIPELSACHRPALHHSRVWKHGLKGHDMLGRRTGRRRARRTMLHSRPLSCAAFEADRVPLFRMFLI